MLTRVDDSIKEIGPSVEFRDVPIAAARAKPGCAIAHFLPIGVVVVKVPPGTQGIRGLKSWC